MSCTRAQIQMMRDWGMSPILTNQTKPEPDEADRIKSEDWQPPIDIDANYVPEENVPADWALQEAFAKARAKESLAEEPKDPSAGYTIYVEDTD